MSLTNSLSSELSWDSIGGEKYSTPEYSMLGGSEGYLEGSNATTPSDSAPWYSSVLSGVGSFLSNVSGFVGQVLSARQTPTSSLNTNSNGSGQSFGDATLSGAFNGLMGWFEQTPVGQQLIGSAVEQKTNQTILDVVKSPIFWLMGAGLIVLIILMLKKRR